MFRDDAKPTRANVKKRFAAAEEALSSAGALLRKMPDDLAAQQASSNALAWLRSAKEELDTNKGRRRK